MNTGFLLKSVTVHARYRLLLQIVKSYTFYFRVKTIVLDITSLDVTDSKKKLGVSQHGMRLEMLKHSRRTNHK